MSIGMVCREGRADVGQVSVEPDGLLDCDAFSPRDQVPAFSLIPPALNRTVSEPSLS